MSFSTLLLNLKMTFFIAFILVSKLRSCPVAAIDLAGAGIKLIIPDAKEIAVVVIIFQEEIAVTRLLLLAVIIRTVA